MRPVIFDYATAQHDENWTNVEYDHDLDLCKVNGKTILESSPEIMSCATKTEVNRESDDAQEVDPLSFASKTNAGRESDDVCYDTHFMLLTKTKVQLESDDE